MIKVFNKDGNLKLRFAENASEQIKEWLAKNETTEKEAMNHMEKIKDPVFGNAVEFPCSVLLTTEQLKDMNKIFITTTLPYINADRPHAGHFLEFVQADVITRYLRINFNVRFNVGVDEHGLKIYEQANNLGLDPQKYCDKQAEQWKKFFDKFNITYDNFYRTTSQVHKLKIQDVWNYYISNGDIYKKTYTGLYCKGCESFKLDKDLVNGKCSDHDIVPEKIEEDNWFFKIIKYKKNLLKWLEHNSDFLLPKYKLSELKNIIEESEDISVSRLKTSVPWGIEVPNDSEQVIYCWLEALHNYLFAANYDSKDADNFWNNNLTIIIAGPDNIRFQGHIFQIFLEALNVKHTTKLLIHGTVLDKDGHKMSKTLGNVIDPIAQIDKFGLDAVRYYAIAGLTTFGDGCWSEKDLVELHNSELADNFGNLLARVLHLIDLKKVEVTDVDFEFKEIVCEKISKVESAYAEFNLYSAVREITGVFKFGNQYMNSAEPWRSEHYVSTLSNLHYLLTVTVGCLSPVIPDSCERALTALKECKKTIIFPKIKCEKE